jgi:hypothetical protein
VIYKIGQKGKLLDKSLYTIDNDQRIFTTTENNLTVNFKNLKGWTFRTGNNCKFKTGNFCTFYVGDDCKFSTWSGCVFIPGDDCELVYLYNKKTYKLKPKIISILTQQYGIEIVELKDKNEALLNIKHDCEYVRKCCERILKNEL